MKTTVNVIDSRINRNNDAKGYMELCTELVQSQGYDKSFTSGWQMTYNEFKTTYYKKDRNDIQIDITLNFVTGEAIITVDTPEKSPLDLEMELWEARANDEFGQTLKEIEKAAFSDLFTEENEYGFISTPISHYITSYLLDGNRKSTAKVVISTLEDYDVIEDVKELAEKLKQLAA